MAVAEWRLGQPHHHSDLARVVAAIGVHAGALAVDGGRWFLVGWRRGPLGTAAVRLGSRLRAGVHQESGAAVSVAMAGAEWRLGQRQLDRPLRGVREGAGLRGELVGEWVGELDAGTPKIPILMLPMKAGAR